jgi:ABC-2 type transport system ATP-binding protein
MIAASGLTKTYGGKTAVDGITFTVEPGRVTGFLGPNGAGKSTTMRMILGLDRPLGMGQRRGFAVALLGNPPVVVLDEPVNGLDPEGIRWVRTLARQLATEGRTVFVSSHLMSEMALTADHLVVIGRGRVLADCSMSEFIADHAASYVRVRSPERGQVADLLRRQGLDVAVQDDELRVQGLDAAAIGELVGQNGLYLHELTLVRSSLEDAFMTLTAESVEYSASTPAGIAR